MTRKDFELIADQLRQSRPPEDVRSPWNQMVLRFSIALALTNKQFNRATFLHACGHVAS
jgi:hypothetical protein